MLASLIVTVGYLWTLVKVNVVVLGVAEIAFRVFFKRKEEGSEPTTS